jgi:hypothetical protein
MAKVKFFVGIHPHPRSQRNIFERHGDEAAYILLIRLVQRQSLRYVLLLFSQFNDTASSSDRATWRDWVRVDNEIGSMREEAVMT